MEERIFQGTGVAMVTPFQEDASIDFEALKRLVDFQVSSGVDYLVLLGTTAETPSLTEKEQWAVVEFVMAHLNGQLPVVVGLSSNNTHALLKRMRRFNFEGIAGLLSAAPYYNKPTQEGLYQHFAQVASTSMVPVILYNVPGRTASNISAQTTLRLAYDFNNIVAIKEASGDLEQIGEVLAKRPNGFSVLSGDDMLALPLIAMGADGVISVTANAWPTEFTQMVRAAMNQDFTTARQLHFHLRETMNLLVQEGNPAGIKAALTIRKLIQNYLRLPLMAVSDTLYQQIANKL